MQPVSSSKSPPAAGLPERMERLGAAFELALRQFLRDFAAEPVEHLHDGIAYALAADLADPAQRGKRIRPLLCLLTAEALGAEPRRAMPFAVAIELMHNFALVHDDMEDGDVMRRGRPAVWVRYGTPHAINIGDYLLVRVMTALTDWGTPDLDNAQRFRLVQLIARALDHTHVGQALDLNARNSRSIDRSQYMRIVLEKTGYYLAAPIQGGAIVAGADDATLEIIAQMAHLLGPLFQIIDDIIDLTDGKGRESTGSDIREGKRSYLVAYTAERCTAAERERLFDILDKPREQTTPDDIREVEAIFARYGAIEAGRAYCQELYKQSCAVLKRLPPALAAVLGPLFEQLVHRTS